MDVRSLEALSPPEFAEICICILRYEISRAVKPLNPTGPDGGRDAILEGPCQTSRYPNWDGLWIFQFKHYRGEVTTTRKNLLKSFEEEVSNTLRCYPETRNYIFLTSVPLSGVSGSGTLDKVREKISRIKSWSKANIDIWDGYTVCDLLEEYPKLLERFNLRRVTPYFDSAVISARKSSLWDDSLLTCDIDTFSVVLRNIVGDDLRPLNPGATSSIGISLVSSDFSRAYQQLRNFLLVAANYHLGSDKKRVDQQVYLSWVKLATALAAARVGESKVAIIEARRALRLGKGDPGLEAWCWNVLSIVSGKLERNLQYAAANTKAKELALQSGDFWLYETVRLRELHKLSWASSEQGQPISNSYFEDEIRKVDIPIHSCSQNELNHLRGQREAYLALHFTWQPNQHDRANEMIRAAESSFSNVGDQAELTRMISERGRLTLLGGENRYGDWDAISTLQRALSRRVRSGELARVRYDLLWLSIAHKIQKWSLAAEVCAWLCVVLHLRLYASRQVDTKVYLQALNIISSLGNSLRNKVVNNRMPTDRLTDLIADATGLDIIDCMRISSPQYFRQVVLMQNL